MTRLVKMDIRVEKADLDSARLIHHQRVARAIQAKVRLPREAEVHREVYHRGLKGIAEDTGLIRALNQLDGTGVVVLKDRRFYVIPVNPEVHIHPDYVVFGPRGPPLPSKTGYASIDDFEGWLNTVRDGSRTHK